MGETVILKKKAIPGVAPPPNKNQVQMFIITLHEITEVEQGLLLDFENRFKQVYSFKVQVYKLVKAINLLRIKKKEKFRKKALKAIGKLKDLLGHYFHLREKTTTDEELEESLLKKESAWIHESHNVAHHEYAQWYNEFYGKHPGTSHRRWQAVRKIMMSLQQLIPAEERAESINNHLRKILAEFRILVPEERQYFAAISKELGIIEHELENLGKWEITSTELEGAKHGLAENMIRLVAAMVREKNQVITPFNKFLKTRRDFLQYFEKYEKKWNVTEHDIASDLEMITTPHEAMLYIARMGKYRYKMTRKARRALERKAEIKSLSTRRVEEYARLAHEDQLTGVNTRRVYFDVIEKLISECVRPGYRQDGPPDKSKMTPFALLIVDIDYFKDFNTKYGYAVGDRVLRYVAQRMKKKIRRMDFIFRYGGEEFVILFKTVNRSKAEDLADYIREEVEEGSKIFLDKINLEKMVVDPVRAITVSIGVSLFPRDGLKSQILFNEANDALQNKAKAFIYLNDKGERVHGNKVSLA